MLRTFDIIMIAAMLVAATVTYTIKYDAEKQIAVIAKLKRQIDSEKTRSRFCAPTGLDDPAGPSAEPCWRL